MNCKIYILTLLSCLFGIVSYSQNIEFIENKGQWDASVLYMGRVSNGAFYIHRDGYTVLQHHSEDWNKILQNTHRGNTESSRLRSHSYRVNFVNAGARARIVADKALTSYNNYFIGNDPSKWATECRIYLGITIKDIYPNIDLRYYSDNGTLKYDLIVNPGGDVKDIALKYTGADQLRVKNRELIIGTSVGELRESSPFTYQYNEKGKVEIGAKYMVRDNTVRFDINKYDASNILVIDPSLVFCSFSGSKSENWGYTATYGPDGSMYGGGIVKGDGFPTSPGAFDGAHNGGDWDIGIIKLSPDGSTMLYSTYIGGSGTEQPHSLIVDGQGNLVLAGRTNSVSGTAANKYPTTAGGAIGASAGYEIAVTKLNATGTALIGSRTIGGSQADGVNIRDVHEGGEKDLIQNYGDDGRSEVNLDAAGNVYVASCTRSNDFPIVGGFQAQSGGDQDGVVLKFSPNLSTLLFSSYLGGDGPDAAYVVTLAPDNSIYVAGGTKSTNLNTKFNTAGTVGPVSKGVIDGFVAIISNDGSSLIKLAHIGTGAIDQVYGIQFDQKGFPYIMGLTRGTWIPQNAPWSQPGGKQFIAKLQPDLSAFIYSTTFGKGQATPDISPTAFLVDRCENVYVSGWGGDSNFPNAGVQGLTVTPDAIKSTPDIFPNGLGGDFYFFVLKKDAVSQLYGSFFGQNNTSTYHDHVDGGTSRFDSEGVIYQAICASCGNNGAFPTTPGVFAPNKPIEAYCNLAMVKIAFNLAGVGSGITSYINGTTRGNAGCIPLTVDFVDTVLTAKKYEWYFNDGTTPSPVITTTPNITHTFTQVGQYQVMLVAIDSNSCNIRDTSYITITASDLKAQLDFNPVKLNPCDSFKYRFDNLSTSPPTHPFGPQSFIWDFGDNSPRVTTGPGAVFHNYASPGTYTVRMFLNDSAFCNFPDTVVKQVRVAALVEADFETPPQGCAPYDAQFNNVSQAGAQFIWNFGDPNDPTPSTDVNPSHLYTLPGTYTVTLVAIDSATCNITDTTSYTITVFGNPVADFSASPQPPIVNTPISFTNLSSPDAVRFKWLFGDGDSLVTTSRAVVQHEYVSSQTYTVCLIAYNQADCPDTVCKDVTTLIEPAVDVPNAFTPTRGGTNSVVYVRGFGIAKMKFTVWARWGEKVFETNSKHTGWNGYYKGKLLPMDVYAYTLEVEFSDGTKTTKTGDITLIK
ncbi:MAG TPA: PKD domain-containing protein [Flavisolibacter sp.]